MKREQTVRELLTFNLPRDGLQKFQQQIKLNFKRQPSSIKLSRIRKTVSYKGYPRFKETVLPKAVMKNNISLVSSLTKRHSVRKYKFFRMTLSQISNLCYYSFGLKNFNDPSQISHERFYPSAGARYPIEIYLLTLNSSLPKGLYHYYFKKHSLEHILDINKFSGQTFFKSNEFELASCLVIMTSILNRSKIKYGIRSYPFAMIEAGHIGQNISLVSSGLGLSCCPIGGFDNYEFDHLLDIDGINETSVYVFAIGKK